MDLLTHTIYDMPPVWRGSTASQQTPKLPVNLVLCRAAPVVHIDSVTPKLCRSPVGTGLVCGKRAVFESMGGRQPRVVKLVASEHPEGGYTLTHEFTPYGTKRLHRVKRAMCAS
jgi:hypothetical protein